MRLTIYILTLLATFAAFAAGPEGDLTPWLGEYTVTKCIVCLDHKVDGGANTKNFSWFGIGAGKIDAKDRLGCAQTDTWVGFAFEIKSDDGSDSNVANHVTGQCDWDYNSTLVATADTFTYVVKGAIRGRKLTVSLKRTGPDSVEFYKYEENESPSWGYPKSWEWRVEAKKTK